VEIALLAGVVIAVAVLTELRPGGAQRAVAAPVVAAQPATLPSKDAVVEAKELGSLVLAVARTPATVTVTLIGPDGTGLDGRGVTVDGTQARSCGSGCYRAPAVPGGLSIGVGGKTVVFDLPARAPDATDLLRRVDRAFRSARTAVFDETLASSPTNGQTTRFTLVAPDRLSYQTKGGPGAIVIGPRRWDRDSARAAWLPSPQTPLDVMQPYWDKPTNAHLVAPNVLTFLDRRIPAWFHVTLNGVRPTRVRMTAAAHFMVDRYVGFNVPAVVSPPPSR
jgi:hypothetical protein